MDKSVKLWMIIYFSLLSILCALSFGLVDVPVAFIYASIIFLFLCHIVLNYSSSSRRIHLAFLSCSTFILLLMIIDPVELGLYGYDPYSTSVPSFEMALANHTISSLIRNFGSLPLFYTFSGMILNLTGYSLETTAKYTPLISTLAPPFLYVILVQFTDIETAHLISIGFMSTRTLLSFYSKFVDEVIALVLFLVLLLILTLRVKKYLYLPVMVSIVLSHPAVSAITGTFLIIYQCISNLVSAEFVPNRIKPKYDSSTFILVPILLYFVTVVIFYAYVGESFFATVSSSILASATEGQTSATAGSVTSTDISVLGLISRAAIPVLGLYIILCIASVFSSRQPHISEQVWIGFGAFLSVIYIATLFGGRVVPLDPIRWLIYLVPMVVAPGLIYLRDAIDQRTIMEIVSIILIILLIITQVAAYAPHNIKSDRSETTLSESHFSIFQHQASEWASHFVSGEILVYEIDIWAAYENQPVDIAQSEVCNRQFITNRGFDSSFSNDKIYSNGDIHLEYCT